MTVTSESLGVRQEAIEDALVALFQGTVIDIEGVPTTVAVLLEEPNVEDHLERTYPSITITYLGETPDEEVLRESSTEEEEVAYDNTVNPPVRTMRREPEPTKLFYSIDTWNKTRAQTNRDLVFWAIRRKVRHRGFITVKTVDGQDVDLWMFWQVGPIPANENYPDMIVYHTSMSVVIYARMAVVDNSETTDEKVATTIQWDVWSKKVEENVGDKLDVSLEITENGVKPIN